MKKLVCPCCGWSDFLKYTDSDKVYCQACRLEYTEDEVLKFEKEVPEDETGDYGITVIDKDRGGYGSFNGHKSDAYYDKWVKEAVKYNDRSEGIVTKKDEGGGIQKSRNRTN